MLTNAGADDRLQQPSNLILTNGWVIDPAQAIDEVCEVGIDRNIAINNPAMPTTNRQCASSVIPGSTRRHPAAPGGTRQHPAAVT